MRPTRSVTAEEENFRLEPIPGVPNARMIKRDPVKPEPEGTIVLVPFRVTGYDPDCDGSLMARMEGIDLDGKTTGWEVDSVGLGGCLVVTPEELRSLGGGDA